MRATKAWGPAHRCQHATGFATFGKNAKRLAHATDVGTYGTRYLDRATVALAGSARNLAADAVYPAARASTPTGRRSSGGSRYVLHFAKGADAAGERVLVAHDVRPDGYLVANPIDRFAIGDRDKLVRNADGSLDLYIQPERPEGPRAQNWLPAPDGPFQLLLRMYWPKQPILDGQWSPPPIKKAGAVARIPRQKI